MKFLKRLLLVVVALVILINLGAFAVHKYNEHQEEKKYELGMELYQSGLVKVEDARISFGAYGQLTGKIINESDKVINELEVRLQLTDITKNMVYEEATHSIYKTVPPNQLRSFTCYHHLHHTPEDIKNEFEWKVVRVSAREPRVNE